MEEAAQTQFKPLVIDINDWHQRPWFTRIHDVNVHLEAKGFCSLKTGLKSKVKAQATSEVEELKEFGALDRMPKEAHCCLFGETCSSWSTILHPQQPDQKPLASEAGLREVEEHLQVIGDEISVASSDYMGFSFLGRMPMRVHHSKMPSERGAPPLHDVTEAEDYIKQAQQKRLVLLYYLGPGQSKLKFTPRADPKRIFEATVNADCLLIYRTDALSIQLETENQVIMLQMDFVARTRQAVMTRLKELLPVPDTIDQWYSKQLKDEVSKGDLSDDLPFHVKHEALRLYSKPQGGMPIRVCQFWHDLPTIPFFGGNVPPVEASILGGLDSVTEIVKGSGKGTSIEDFGAKWDMSEYYDEDPSKVSEFKMYTRHMSVLNRGHDPKDDYDLLDLKISTLENLTIDPKHRMVAESVSKCLQETNVDSTMTRGEEIGYFVGISGTNDQYYHFLTKESKIGKYTWSNMSNAAMVSRLSYMTGSKGPCIAVDTEDSSGLGAVDAAVRDLRSERCSPFAIASAVSSFTNPFQLIVLCATQLLSRSGRSKVFDESCDGYVKGEGVISAFLEPGGWEMRPQDKKTIQRGAMPGSDKKQPVGIRCLITGSACSAQGNSSALGIQSAPGMIDLLDKCCRDSGMQYPYIDAIEVDAGGRKLADLMELGVLMNRTGLRDENAAPIAVRSHKSNFGNLGPCSGIVGIFKSAMLLEKGLHGPAIHLRQHLDISDLPTEEGQSSRLFPLTEVIEAKPMQTVSVNSFSATGTNLTVMLQGKVPDEDFLIMKATGTSTVRTTGKALHWWPGGEQKESKAPMRGYFIVGSWTNWEFPTRMEEEGEGVYGFTLTMGENNWETFQIWVDEDWDQVIHPMNPKDVKNSKASLPEQSSKTLCWLVDGRNDWVRLVNEEQMKVVQTKGSGSDECRADPLLDGRAFTFNEMCTELAKRSGVKMSEGDLKKHWDELEEDVSDECVVAYQGDYVPSDETSEAKHCRIADMPLIQRNHEDAAKPGDKFRVRLHARGKYRRVEWSKMSTSDASVDKKEVEPYAHKYQIIGDHNYWTFQDMSRDEIEIGMYAVTVHMLKPSSSFQIYRNGDWEQGFFPSKQRGSSSDEVLGPSGEGMGLNWTIEGKVGDLVRITFRRSIVDGKDERSISWQTVGFEKVDFEAISKQHKWHVIGSFTGFKKSMEMQLDEETGHLKAEITVGKSGKEYFQFLLDGNFLSALHPATNEATMHDEAHELLGPDDDGSGKYWAIGLHPQDATIGAGNHVFIHLEVEGGLPKRVWWEKYDSPDAHREYLAQGCWNTFDRHCRMLGFKPYQNEKNKAKMLKPPQFVTMPPGTFKVDGPQI